MYYLERLIPETMKLLGNSEKRQINIKMVKMCHILKLLKQYQVIVILLKMIINMI